MEDYLTQNIAERMTHLISMWLTNNCPKLSGSMSSHISYRQEGKNKWVITISGPSYDLIEYNRSGIVKYTGEYDYALSVNKFGAFEGKSTKSQHWVNKTLAQCLQVIQAQFNANLQGDVE